MDGDHSIARCEEVATYTLQAVFRALIRQRVALEKMLLKTGMVLSGQECEQQAADTQVAEATVRCFRRSVPPAVPGIVFLSGGQRDVPATRRLNAICRTGDLPWHLTFSYGRALQDAAMRTWRGSAGKLASGQAALRKRANLNGRAVKGAYSGRMERTA
jgi:fructose-bisphosphate aldolase class I